jgi:broad specificity phosphatase PhoE
MRVVLVRHAQSAVDPSTPPSTWGLTEEGRRRAAELDLRGLRLLAGPEPKLIQTLEPHGVVDVDERFAESHSEGWLGDDEFAATIERYFAAPDRAPAPGWEPAASVVERFDLVEGAAIASGGRAIAAVVAAHTGGDGLALWRSLRMPHVIVLDPRAGEGGWIASTP